VKSGQEILVKYSLLRMRCDGTWHKACRQVHVLLPRDHGGGALGKITKDGKTPKEKFVGELISGCTSIEIIPPTFKYAPASHLSPLRSFLLPPPLPLTTPRPSRPVLRPPAIIPTWTRPSPNALPRRPPQSMASRFRSIISMTDRFPTGSRQLYEVLGHAPSVAQPRSIYAALLKKRSDLTVT